MFQRLEELAALEGVFCALRPPFVNWRREEAEKFRRDATLFPQDVPL